MFGSLQHLLQMDEQFAIIERLPRSLDQESITPEMTKNSAKENVPEPSVQLSALSTSSRMSNNAVDYDFHHIDVPPARNSILISASGSTRSSSPKLNNIRVLQNVLVQSKSDLSKDITSTSSRDELSEDSISSIQSKMSAISNFDIQDELGTFEPDEILFADDDVGQLLRLNVNEEEQLIVLPTSDTNEKIVDETADEAINQEEQGINVLIETEHKIPDVNSLESLSRTEEQCEIVDYTPDSHDEDENAVVNLSYQDIRNIIIGEEFVAMLDDREQLPSNHEPIAIPVLMTYPVDKAMEKKRSATKKRKKAKKALIPKFHVTGDSRDPIVIKNPRNKLKSKKSSSKASPTMEKLENTEATSESSRLDDKNIVSKEMVVNVSSSKTDNFRLKMQKTDPVSVDTIPKCDDNAQQQIYANVQTDKVLEDKENNAKVKSKINNNNNLEKRRMTRSANRHQSNAIQSEGFTNQVDANSEHVVKSIVCETDIGEGNDMNLNENNNFATKTDVIESTESIDMVHDSSPTELTTSEEQVGNDECKTSEDLVGDETTSQLMPKKTIETEIAPLNGNILAENGDVVFVRDNDAVVDITSDAQSKSHVDTTFSLGDLMYGRMQCYWPCMITRDPATNTYCQKWSHLIKYHVQFFGDRGRRAWLTKNSLMPFTGPNTVRDYMQQLQSNKREQKKSKSWKLEMRGCTITKTNEVAWHRGVDEALSLVDKSVAERVVFFDKLFSDLRQNEVEQKVTKKKRKRQLSDDEDVKPSIEDIELDVKEDGKRKRKRMKLSQTDDSDNGQTSSKITDIRTSTPLITVVKEEPQSPKPSTSAKKRKITKLSAGKKGKKMKQPNGLQYAQNTASFINEDLDLIRQGRVADFNEIEIKTEVIEDIPELNVNERQLKKTGPKRRSARQIIANLRDVPKNELERFRAQLDAAELADSDAPSHQSGPSSNIKRSLFKDIPRVPVCQLCFENTGRVLKCKGPCAAFYHEQCARVKVENEAQPDSLLNNEFRCSNCELNIESLCFACGSFQYYNKDAPRYRCSIAGCGRSFHEGCLKEWPQAEVESSKSDEFTFKCPMHHCHICISDNPKQYKHLLPPNKICRCLMCPATYHRNPYCIPAGTDILSMSQIICPRHVQPTAKRYTINVDWCFSCTNGGQLMCCETCPMAVHRECNPAYLRPNDAFICEGCESGRLPLYNDIVWAKFSNYQWWPAQIIFPEDISERVMRYPHRKGEFVVRFFGTHDHHWIALGRLFLFQTDDDKGTCVYKKEIMFERAVAEAKSALIMQELLRKQLGLAQRMKEKPQPYKKIRVNYVANKKKEMDADRSITPACHCTEDMPHPCGPESQCVNMLVMSECDPMYCPMKERCENQRFEKRLYPPLVPYRTEYCGWGLKCTEPLVKGQFVIEYVGEIIDQQQYQQRVKKMQQERAENFYFLSITPSKIIDAGPKGNLARFINHSCVPNCATQKWNVRGQTRIGLFALEDIAAETELTFNYNLVSDGLHGTACHCNAAKCSRYIGVKVNQETEKKQKALTLVCFICGENGADKQCGLKVCGKWYHANCMEQKWHSTKSATGRWLCPRHICDDCEERTIRLCVKCTTSYCGTHLRGQLKHIKQKGFMCHKHWASNDKTGEVNHTAT